MRIRKIIFFTLSLPDRHPLLLLDYKIIAGEFFIEENSEKGGAGAAVLEVLSSLGLCKPLLILGIPDTVTAHGDAKLILQDLGLDADSVIKRIKAFVGE